MSSPSMASSAGGQGVNKPKYTKIHATCKYRLFNLLDEIEKPEKVMTLGQLREIMTGCLEGKKAKDQRCKSSGLNIVTLENYLYEFLEQRYNSNNPVEIKEWLTALSKAISKFGIFDSDICVFGKMLKNMLSETFPDHQRTMRNTADKLMGEKMSTTAWNKKMYDGIPMRVFEKTVLHMFNQKDAAEIMKRVKDPLPRTGKRGASNLEALAREHVRYIHGIEVLLTFNMNLQDDFLHDFVVAYREVDLGKDGVLTTSEVTELVNRFSTVESVKEGSSAYTALQEAKASTMRQIRKARRLTFSETVEQFTDLLSARWSVTGKKGTRYQHHDHLKQLLMQNNMEEKKEEQGNAEKLKSVLKKISKDEKEAAQKSALQKKDKQQSPAKKRVSIPE